MSMGMVDLGFLPAHPDGIETALLAVAIVLSVTTLVRSVRWIRARGDGKLRRALASIGSWWVLFGLLVAMVSLGPWAAVASMALISLLLLRETLGLAGHAAWLPPALIGAGVAFLLVWRGGHGVLTGGVPMAAIILLAGEAIWRRRNLRSDSGGGRGGVVAAWLLGTVGPLYAAGTALLPHGAAGDDHDLGWFLLLVVLTAVNDSSQAWWGRALGSHRLAPSLSPGKTWEGLAGGVLTTSIAALLLGPLVTPVGRVVPFEGAGPGLPWLWCVLLAVILSAGGLAGDLLASRLKRTAGVKDSGEMVPGQGGLLDRVDSLTVTAPVLYLAAWLFWHG